MKKFFSVRCILTYLLILSAIYAAYAAYYKIEYWGFNFAPKQNTNVWTIEAHVFFTPNGEPIKVSLARPTASSEFKILEEDVVANGFKVKEINKNSPRIIATAKAGTEGEQNLYYRVLLFDNVDGKGRVKANPPKKPEVPVMDDQLRDVAKELLNIAKTQYPNDEWPAKIIKLFNQLPPEPTVVAFLPMKKTQKDVAEAVKTLLAMEGISSRIVRGIKLEENKKSMAADLMLEAYIGGKWKLFNLKTGEKGLPKNFVIFQRGGDSLLDVEGGENSAVKFSVLKSITSSFKLAGKRAELADQKIRFDYSIYNLPLAEQNTLKWLSIFPLAILIVVLMRNVVGIQTMGTFTPMLLAMALTKTGFVPGLIAFGIIIVLGLSIRFWLSKLNLLLVPRISAVVIFVILIMQILTIIGYQFDFKVGLSAIFFPIIIMAWIIERASITWEEDGAANACREIVYSLVVAVITYFVVNNEYIRHIMFAFDELNLVILFTVMLLGTYTGYRLTELSRFAPLVKDKE